MDEILKIEHLVKTFGTNEVLKDIDFSVYKGNVISIIGSSGSGKSTLLRCINMLEEATGGKILFHWYSSHSIFLQISMFSTIAR